MRRLLAATLLLCTGLATPAVAQQQGITCTYGICQVRLTPDQLLAQAEAMVRARRFADAEPLIAALAQAPDMKLQSRFLSGYAASEQGDYAHAASTFKAILAEDPGQTRVRLELARAMLGLGQTASADRQFKIAQQADDLPPDVAAAIRGARQVIRSRRTWRFDVDFGIAPDSNINNATAADSVNVLFDGGPLQVPIDGNTRAKSGTGQTASVSAGIRLPVGDQVSVLGGLDTSGTNYAGKTFDDYSAQATAGAEVRLSNDLSLSLEGVAAQRWFGGIVASRQFGARGGAQIGLSDSARIGIQLDARRTTALFDTNYSGWQAGLYATGEKAVSRTLVASFGGFARRDWLTARAYSNTELGLTSGLGGELPLGITFGISGSVSRATYDAPIPIFSLDPRHDWRYGGRLTLGNRAVRVFGFSPQVALSYNRNKSTIAYYATDRLRLRVALARYF